MPYDCRINGRQQGYICIFGSIATLIYNTSLITKCCLLHTLHHDIILHLRHPDGIESYQLHDGIGNALVSDALGYPEILQFIIHEVDGVLMLAGIQILQRRRERHILILSGDALGIRLLNPKQQEEKKKLSDRLAVNGHWFPKISHKYILLSYFTINVPSIYSICMRSKAFKISRFCSKVFVLFQLKKRRMCWAPASTYSTLT